MSKELEKTENEIIKNLELLERYEEEPVMYEKSPDDFVGEKIYLPNSKSLKVRHDALEKKRQFELERKQRQWYNQSWFHILVTSIFSIITTVVAAWIISKIS